MSNIEKQLPEMLARWKSEDMKKILTETVGEKESYTNEEYQTAYELLEEKEFNDKKQSIKDYFEKGINLLNEVADTFEDPDISTDDLFRKILHAEDYTRNYLRYYSLEMEEELRRLFSQARIKSLGRSSIFSKKNKNKKQFRLTEAEREVKLMPIRPLMKELAQKVESLRMEQKV
jgi:hypothetical protein